MKVELITHTPEPLKVMAWVKGLIEGKHMNLSEISDNFAEEEFIDSLRSAIYASFEFVHFVFDVTDVPRAFTHQFVRTRAAAYMQESLRFSTRKGGFEFETGPSVSNDPAKLAIYNDLMASSASAYDALLKMGANTEDARGILPINILTSISQSITYRSLINVAEQRLCRQAQGLHQEVLKEMKKLLSEKVHPMLGAYLAPSCSHTGFCSWGGRLDRPCSLQKIYPMKPDPLAFIEKEKELL